MNAQPRISTPSSSLPSRTRRAWMIVLSSMLAAVLAVSVLWQLSAGPVAAHATMTTPSNLPSSACVNVVNTGGGSCIGGPAVLTSLQQQILSQKSALAEEYAQVRAGTLSYTTFQSDLQAFMSLYGGPTAATAGVSLGCPSLPGGPYAACGENYVGLVQQPQQTYYYCGPATASEVLKVRGKNVSQSTLAGNSYLKTNEDGGTNWSPQVMAPTLNTLLGTQFYVSENGSGVGGGFSTSMWINDLTSDIDAGWAIAGNTVEYQNQNPHLVGHPSNLTIYHWIGIYGYQNAGNYTMYADSIHGTTFWSWSGNVPAYTTAYSSSSMTTLLNGRGYVW